MLALLLLLIVPADATPQPDPCTVGFSTFIDEQGVDHDCPSLPPEHRARVERAEDNVSRGYAKDACMGTDNPLACMEAGEPPQMAGRP